MDGQTDRQTDRQTKAVTMDPIGYTQGPKFPSFVEVDDIRSLRIGLSGHTHIALKLLALEAAYDFYFGY